YYDVRLSSDNTIACATCHNPQLGFSDGRRVSAGFGGHTGSRNAPTVLNAAFWPMQFWDGRAASLVDQAGGPIAHPIETKRPHDQCVAKLNSDPAYPAAFGKVFGPGRITLEKVEKVIASFERTVVSGNSPFDRYQYAGDKAALSPAAIRGLALFQDSAKGDC